MTRCHQITEHYWQRRVLELATLLTEEALAPDLFDRFLGMLSHDFPGSSSLLDYDANEQRTEFVGCGVDASARQAYGQHFHLINPFTKAILSHRLYNNTYLGSRWVDHHDLVQTEFYNDWLRPRGERFLLVLSIGFSDGGRTGLPIYRGEAEGGDFTAEDTRRLDMLRKFLTNAVILRRLFRHHGGWSNGQIDPAKIALPVISTDRNRPAPCNDAGELLLLSGSPDRRSGQIPIRPLTPAASRVITPPFLESSKLIFIKRYGLSRREAEVAALLCDGLSYEEAAARLGISYHTVNTYVKSILRKLNLSSTRHLPRLLRTDSAIR